MWEMELLRVGEVIPHEGVRVKGLAPTLRDEGRTTPGFWPAGALAGFQVQGLRRLEGDVLLKRSASVPGVDPLWFHFRMFQNSSSMEVSSRR